MKNSIARMLISIGVISFLVAGTVHLVNAAEFFCVSGDVACLIASINTANNAKAEQHTIFLEPGTYTLTAVDNDTDGPNGLPWIKKTITIRPERSGRDRPERPQLSSGSLW